MKPDSRTAAISGRFRRPRMSVILVAILLVGMLMGYQSLSPSVGGAQPDDTAALQEKFDAAVPGGRITLDSRVYKHSGVITLRVPNVQIDGNGATLEATNDETSGLQIVADGVALSNVTVAAPADGPRYSAMDQHKVVIRGKNDTLSDVTVEGSAAAGVFVSGAVDFTLRNLTVTGTRADGIHITDGSSAGLVDNVRVQDTGDDAIAVVSYGTQSAPCSDIQITHADVGSTRWGRGITVVGGRNVTVRDFTVANTNAAGLYIANEGDPYFTQSVEQVNIFNGSLTRVNNNPDVIQGALQLFSGNAGKTIRGVRVSDVNIVDTPTSAGRDVAVVLDGGTMSDISITGIHLSGSEVDPFDVSGPVDGLITSGWTQNNEPISVGVS